MGLKELMEELEGLMCAFCVSCRQDIMTHKEFITHWHDQFAIQGYKIINEIDRLLEHK